MRTISNSDNIIDSRDVIKRIAELEGERADCEGDDIITWDDDNGEELKALQDFASEGESLSDWPHGETLINDDYFEDYARELADDIGPKAKGWPYDYIDWERAADALKMDYTSLDFDGQTYWGRS